MTTNGWHGRRGNPSWAPPVCVSAIDVHARLSFTKIKANEYQDTAGVLRQKIAALADLIRQSTDTLIFTGAGISVAAGIDDYASKGRDSNRLTVKRWRDAQPTVAHRVLADMYHKGLAQYWIQQNHDSLPQKAGFPQHSLNEIHGSLHDPSNPVVPYHGNLRSDLFESMQVWQERAQLCLAMGTSLSGFNVDQVAQTMAQRDEQGNATGGLVLINLQQTEYDSLCSLRLFCTTDEAMTLLAQELKLPTGIHDPHPLANTTAVAVSGSVEQEEDLFVLPDGVSTLDLRVGARLKVTSGPYEGDVGTVMSRDRDGHYTLRMANSVDPTFKKKLQPFNLVLGRWWVDECIAGHCIQPPCCNVPHGCTDHLGVAVSDAKQPCISKYLRLSRIGVPVVAIVAQMRADGLSAHTIREYAQAGNFEERECNRSRFMPCQL